MSNNINEYGYDDCSSRGLCSINPQTSALQEIIFMYLKHSAYYVAKLEELGLTENKLKFLILNSISVMVSNTEFSAIDFNHLKNSFNEELRRVIDSYKKKCKEIDIKPEILKPALNFKSLNNITEFIRFGEKEYNKKESQVLSVASNLYKILFLIIKSICINIITASRYNINAHDEYQTVINLLIFSIKQCNKRKELILHIVNAAKSDVQLMHKIREEQVKRYGEQTQTKVSYSTKIGKAVLVVGSDIFELENILTNLKNFDIYTHGEMLTAHTFPKIRKYKNLIGQYGKGMSNGMLDYSTFPGPIIVTRNSLSNIGNLYRGRLFTTDFAHTKGVIRIENNDFSEVINSLNTSKGFKTGKNCESEFTGFSYNKLINDIFEQINNYNEVFILASSEDNCQVEKYYNSLLPHIPSNYLIISLFCCESKNNIICVNAGYDSYSAYYVAEETLKRTNKKVNIFIPVYKRHTISDLISLSMYKNARIFWNLQGCTTLNPSVINTIKDNFKIYTTSTPKKDLDIILGKI